MRNAVGLFWVLICVAMGAGLVAAETLDRTVAVVNGDIILYSELQEQIRLLQKVSPDLKLEDPGRQEQLERELLQQMIERRLTEQEVQRLKITVSDRDVNAVTDNIKRENNFTDDQFAYVLQQEGKTVEQFRDGIRKELERSRLLDRVFKSKTVITEAQIDEFLKSAPVDSAERRRLGIIYLPVAPGGSSAQMAEVEKLARDIHRRLKEGVNFAGLAGEYSQGPAAKEGGDIGFIATGDLAPDIEKATKGLRKDDFSEPVRTSQGFYIVKILDVQQEKLGGDDSKAREKAHRILLQKEINRKFDDWVRELQSRSFIKIYL